MAKIKIRDIIEVISGDDKGKTGVVLSVLLSEDKVVVEGVNIAKRHKKADRDGLGGGIVDTPMPIHISNLRLLSKGMTDQIKS